MGPSRTGMHAKLRPVNREPNYLSRVERRREAGNAKPEAD